jgi:hypothetical protein
MKVKDMRQILGNFDANDDVYIAVLGEHKAAVFNHFTIGENGSAIQLSSFAQDDPDGIADVAIDVLKKEGSLNYLFKRTG